MYMHIQIHIYPVKRKSYSPNLRFVEAIILRLFLIVGACGEDLFQT